MHLPGRLHPACGRIFLHCLGLSPSSQVSGIRFVAVARSLNRRLSPFLESRREVHAAIARAHYASSAIIFAGPIRSRGDQQKAASQHQAEMGSVSSLGEQTKTRKRSVREKFRISLQIVLRNLLASYAGQKTSPQ
jgi:hypothetical protein